MARSYLDPDLLRQTYRVHLVGVKNGIASLNISPNTSKSYIFYTCTKSFIGSELMPPALTALSSTIWV
jgi:hypothetical protein